jgi:xanthine dehydrogenase YagT iron-sulfur-binding subunit
MDDTNRSDHTSAEGRTGAGNIQIGASKRNPYAAIEASVTLRINGVMHTLVTLDSRTTLLDALREHLGLTGSKKGCDHGQCGACTVRINGRRALACLSLAIAHQHDEITTIEGLADAERLHPMQAAFIECDAFQCGYCTPGQIMSAVCLLEEAARGVPSHATPDVAAPPSLEELSNDEIRERMSGNICRCGAYPNILAAIRQVQRAYTGRGAS